MNLHAVELILQPRVRRIRVRQHGPEGAVRVVSVVSSPVEGAGGQLLIGESQVAPGLLARSISLTCHTVCRRPVESIPTAASIRLGSLM